MGRSVDDKASWGLIFGVCKMSCAIGSLSAQWGPMSSEQIARKKWLPLCCNALLLALWVLLHPTSAWADETPPQCPAGDLLRTARVSGEVDASKLPLLSNTILAREGMPWPSPDDLVVFRGPVLFDLGQPYPVNHLRIQSDADQGVVIEFSLDSEHWDRVTLEPSSSASGMFRRSMNLSGNTARWVRVSSIDSTGILALTELSVYCVKPSKASAVVSVVDDRPPPLRPGVLGQFWLRLTGAPLVSPEQSSVIGLLLALVAGIGGLGFVYLFRQARGSEQRTNSLRRLRDRSLVVLAIISAFSYYHFGAYRYPAFAHKHEFFHYFLGARYFPEIGYTGLYDCAMVAQAEAGFPQRVAIMSLRDLRTNRFIQATDVLANAQSCHAKFSEERWRLFSEDVRYFTNGGSVGESALLVRDHGFNATPLWISLGRTVGGSFAANDTTIGRGESIVGAVLPALDPFLLLASVLVLGWAFGWRTACLAVILFAVDPLTHFGWIGGGYLRQAWFLSFVSAIALLRKRKWIAAGTLLAVAAHFVVFPVFALLGIFLMAGWQWRLQRKPDPSLLRVLASATVTAVFLGFLVLPATGRTDCWQIFSANIAKHAATPSQNLVGLPAALSYSWSERAEVTAQKDALDTHAETRRLRTERLAKMRPVHVGLALASVVGLAALLRRKRPIFWAAALGVSISTVALSLSCYYFSWLVILVPIVGMDSRRLGLLFGSMTGLALLGFVLGDSDTYFAASSFWLVVTIGGFVATLAKRKKISSPGEIAPVGS